MTLNAITQMESNTGGIAFQMEEVRGRVMFLDSLGKVIWSDLFRW